MNRRESALAYLAERTGTMEYRFIRYSAVADALYARGLSDTSLLVDLGAGTCDFDFYLRTVRGWKGRYLPVDASIDGTDLDRWTPLASYDYAVAIELLEHLRDPKRLVLMMRTWSNVFVATTPNTDVLGEEAVVKMDRTHITPLRSWQLEGWGAECVSIHSFFGQPNDSLLAVWGAE